MDLYFRLNTSVLFQSQEIKEESRLYGRDRALNTGEVSVMDPIINIVTGMLHSVKNVIAESDQFIIRFDPLKFPLAQGFPENPLVKFDIDDNDIDFDRHYYQELTKGTGCDFIDTARNTFSDCFDNYNSTYSALKRLARSVLKEKIQARFHLELDPDTVCFMHFDNVMYKGGEKIHYAPACENQTLTEWLFTNFNSETQDNLQDMDAMCGLYYATSGNTEKAFCIQKYH